MSSSDFWSGLGTTVSSDLTAVANAWTTKELAPAPAAVAAPAYATGATMPSSLATLMTGGIGTILIVGVVIYLVVRAARR